MTNDERQALDEWAAQIAALEPDVSKGIITYALRLANDKRIKQADRDFAQAQVDAIRRALRRGKKPKKGTPKR